MNNNASPGAEPPLREKCRRVVRALIAKHRWTVVTEDALVDLIADAPLLDGSPVALEQLAMQHYTIVLYEACRQTEDLDRRERGYHDLFRLLYRVAHNRWPTMAEDITQRALLLVYRQIDHCHNPAAFLSFALFKLRHAAQQEQRARGREFPSDEAHQGALAEERAPLPAALLQQERVQALLDAIRRLPDVRKRQIILLHFFGGLDDEELSERLGITAGHIRVLRYRALQRLRKDRRLQDYFELAVYHNGES